MNVGVSKSSNDILFVNFNQEFSRLRPPRPPLAISPRRHRALRCSCISVGTRHGYKIYNCDPFGKCYGKSDGGIGIVEMLFCTSLVAMVGAGEQPAFSPRRLQLTNTKRQSTICELTFVTAILAVKLNRKRLIVVLEEHIYIYDISNMKLLQTIDTNPNPTALCALSPSSENSYLAYPSDTSGTISSASTQAGPSAAGELLIYDTLNLQAVSIIRAHKTALSAVVFNFDGTMVATSSDKGTVIRVFSVPGGEKLHQLRRGTYPARIYSLAFNMLSTFLAVSSDTDTVHIFYLGRPGGAAYEERGEDGARPSGPGPLGASGLGKWMPSQLGGLVGKRGSQLISSIAGAAQQVLPNSITEVWEPKRDFAYAKLPPGAKGFQNICAMGHQNLSAGMNQPHSIMVVTADGYFYQYSLDPMNGGECQLQKTYSLIDLEEDPHMAR
ncbi:WD40-repeat-containing domain protein [Hyaloraphidium curvatum]|nr:WD40-repeat-containing domain protein [Hyaloraphidium curvatum]